MGVRKGLKLSNEYQEYSTYVLEAKLVAGDTVFSMESEFVTGLDYQEEKANIIKYKEPNKNTEFICITNLPIW